MLKFTISRVESANKIEIICYNLRCHPSKITKNTNHEQYGWKPRAITFGILQFSTWIKVKVDS